MEERGSHTVDISNNGSDIKIYSSVAKNMGFGYTDKFEGEYPSWEKAKVSLSSDAKILGRFEKAHETLKILQFGIISGMFVKLFMDYVQDKNLQTDIMTTLGLIVVITANQFFQENTSEDIIKLRNNLAAVNEASERNLRQYRRTYRL